MEFPDGNANESDNDPLRDLRMPSIGPSPSTFNSERETSHEPDEEPDDDQDDDQDDQDLRSRLNLPPGVTGAESCRSASPGDFQLFVYFFSYLFIFSQLIVYFCQLLVYFV